MQPLSAAELRALQGVVGPAAVLTDAASLLAYESDALTLFRCQPAAVVLPGSRDELAECVKLVHRSGRPFTARGAGTGLSGGVLVPAGGVIFGLARLKQIIEVNAAARWARVEPGVINAQLSRATAQHGLRYAPDPASQSVCTLGGNVAENSGGPQCFLHGSTSQHLLGAELILPNGQIENWGGRTLISDDLDLRGFACGSEGAVGIFTELRLRLVPVPEAVGTFLAAFSDVPTACRAVSAIVAAGWQPVALEVMDQRAIHAVEDSVYRAGLPREAGAILIVEVEGEQAAVDLECAAIEDILRGFQPSLLDRAANAEQRAAIWKGRKGAGGALGRLAPDSYVMDGVVPRSKLAEIMDYVDRIGSQTGLPLANLFHAGDGNIHPHFSYDGRDAEQAERVEAAGTAILRKCLELGGSITGEHGVGVEKQHLMNEQFASIELQIMQRMRQVFNPEDQLNPGKGLPMKRACAEAFARHSPVQAAQSEADRNEASA